MTEEYRSLFKELVCRCGVVWSAYRPSRETEDNPICPQCRRKAPEGTEGCENIGTEGFVSRTPQIGTEEFVSGRWGGRGKNG